MGNRGSKSIVLDASNPFKGTIEESTIVKEQRVYGSCRMNFMRLRYTLTGFEKNSLIRIFPNQINKQARLFSSSAIHLDINRLQNLQINP